MRTHIWVTWYVLLGLLVAAGRADPAESAQEAFEEFLDIWQRYASGTENLAGEHFDYCWTEFVKWEVLDQYADTLIAVAVSHVAPSSVVPLRGPALMILGLFHTEQSEQALLGIVERGDPLEGEAAKILIKWGYWDLAAPILEKHGMYGDLAVDDRALPILRSKLNTADEIQRFGIASILSKRFQDDRYIVAAARDVLRLPTDKETRRFKAKALRVIQKHSVESEIPNVVFHALYDSDPAMSIYAFGTIAYLARNGSAVARAELLNIREHSRWKDVRERAASTLKELQR